MQFSFSSISNALTSLLRRKSGAYRYVVDVINGSTSFKNLAREQEKLATVLANPAVLKVFSLQCDLFSMGEVCIEDMKGKPIEEDPFLNLLKKPNPLPSSNQSQFLWDYMFWNMLGTAYCYVDSRVVEKLGGRNSMYFLDPSKIEWPQEFEAMRDKMVFSEAEIKKLNKTIITYRYNDRSSFSFPFDRLVMSFDLTNGIGNFYKGASRLDALYKIISNTEHVLDSQNINIRYAGKFLVGSENQMGTNSKTALSDIEKKSIIDNMDGSDQNVFPLKTMIQIRRFVENYQQLQLSQEYLSQYFLIGNMYNIPRDVLEAYNSATYENQEKARAAHVNYTLEPKGNAFMNMFENHFDYTGKLNIKISWKHLPFMQVFAKETAETKKITVEVLTSLLQQGVDIKQINEFLGTDFKIKKPKPETNVQSVSEESGEGETEEVGATGGNQGTESGESSAVEG